MLKKILLCSTIFVHSGYHCIDILEVSSVVFMGCYFIQVVNNLSDGYHLRVVANQTSRTPVGVGVRLAS